MSTQFSSIWPIDRPLSGSTTPGKSGLKSNGNEEVLHFPPKYSIIGTWPWYFLESYCAYSLRESYPSAEMQSLYSTTPADWSLDR